MYVVEFTLRAKPGHYSALADAYSSFAADFLATHDALQSVLIVGDEAAGVVRGIGVWTTRDDAEHVNSNPQFATFNDSIAELLAEAPQRIELSLLHTYP